MDVIHSQDWIVSTIQELSLAHDIQEIMKIVRTKARQLTDCDGATFVLKDGNFCFYAEEDAISPLWKGSKFPLNTCISGWTMINKQPAVIEDIYVDDRIPHDAYRPTFVKSLVMVPIRRVSPIGAIGNYWAHNHKATNSEIEALQTLADITAVSIENVTIKSALEKQLEERTSMINHLEKQKQQLEDFTQIIAHDLRAPLSNLSLICDIIEHTNSKEEQNHIVNQQKSVVSTLLQTFNELVDNLHVQKDFNVTSEYVNFESCLQTVLQLLQVDIVSSHTTINQDFSHAPTVVYPLKYIESIFLNLISNSIKYKKENTPLEINICTYLRDRWVFIEFADNAKGIDLDKYGDDVFKLHKTFHNNPNAKGVGLYLIKTQIESMGGKILIESKPNIGTKFTICLIKNV